MIDGVERELRFTQGAMRRIHDHFGMGFRDALNKYDSGAFPGVLYALMYDRKGNPPADLTMEELAESLPMGDAPEVLAAIMSAAEQGRVSKNELEALIRAEMVKDGTNPKPSASSASDSLTNSSGTASPSPKLSIESNNGEMSSEIGTLVSA